MKNTHGQGTVEFMLVMLLLLGIGLYLTSRMVGQQGALPVVQENATRKISEDGMVN